MISEESTTKDVNLFGGDLSIRMPLPEVLKPSGDGGDISPNNLTVYPPTI